MTRHYAIPFLLVLSAVLTACGPKQKEEASPAAATAEAGVLLGIGSITVTQADLDHELKEKHSGRADDAARAEALAALTHRARMVQAALDAKLQHDPAVRAEIARVLANSLKEKELNPRLKSAAAAEIPEARLRDLYTANQAQYSSNEKRQVAVLWLDPANNPDREKQYIEKLTAARQWFLENEDLKSDPSQGFSTLAIDHSEHQASRYQNGIVGWMESAGGLDVWSKAVAGILFSLSQPGAVSEVITRAEGVFLVRYMANQPAILRPFELVAPELARSEQLRQQKAVELDFNSSLEKKYSVRPHQP
jgi:hypothetical protein